MASGIALYTRAASAYNDNRSLDDLLHGQERKYLGCHLEPLVEITMTARLKSGFTRNVAVAPNASMAITSNDTVVGRKAQHLGPASCPSIYSERNTRLKTVARLRQQMTMIADEANARWMCMIVRRVQE
jgi:hypothetical protein